MIPDLMSLMSFLTRLSQQRNAMQRENSRDTVESISFARSPQRTRETQSVSRTDYPILHAESTNRLLPSHTLQFATPLQSQALTTTSTGEKVQGTKKVSPLLSSGEEGVR